MRAVLVLVMAGLIGGCTRAHYRRDADRDTYPTITEHMCPAWALPRTSIDPLPISRLYDPFDPDHPPLPPDDCAAHHYMHRVDGIKAAGWRWHRDGDAPFIEYPGWRQALDAGSADNPLTLTPERSVELGLLHSRDYQTRLESLYVTALNLTFARFDFALHWFGGNNTTFTHSGSSDTESNTLTTQSTLGFTRNFATGAQLLVDFVNTFVWEFAGADSTTMNSNLAITLTQPLLRGAGRKFRLENLTLQERGLLYAVREFARFRKSFTVSLTTGGNFSNGFLGLLQQTQNIRNLRSNLQSLEQNLQLHDAQRSMGTVSEVQVDLVFQQVQQARVALLQAEARLQDSLDQFKITLGLPPTLSASIDDAQLAPFQLNDPALGDLQTEADQFFARYRELSAPPKLERLRDGYARLHTFRAKTLELWVKADAELGRWKAELNQPDDQNRSPLERARVVRDYQTLAKQLPGIRQELDLFGRDLSRDEATLRGDALQDGWDSLQKRTRQEIAIAAELFIVQTQIRVYLIKLRPMRYEEGPALEYALANRLDLMNQRAQVVDSWRQITVAANQLRSDLNLVYRGNLATKPGGTNPFDFRASASSHSVSLQFLGPLNRMAERNTYRTTLINYEQSRRLYMALEDNIVGSIRRDLRALSTDRASFEIARQSLVTAARSVEAARERLLVAERSDNNTTTLEVLSALQNVLLAKSSLISSWVGYESDRMQLLLDLESLQLDERGMVIDEHDDQTGADADRGADLSAPRSLPPVGGTGPADR